MEPSGEQRMRLDYERMQAKRRRHPLAWGVLFTIGHATASVLLLMVASEGILGVPANGVRLAVLFPTSAVLLTLNFVIQWHPLIGFLMSPLSILMNSSVWGVAVACSIPRLRRGRPEETSDSASE